MFDFYKKRREEGEKIETPKHIQKKKKLGKDARRYVIFTLADGTVDQSNFNYDNLYVTKIHYFKCDDDIDTPARKRKLIQEQYTRKNTKLGLVATEFWIREKYVVYVGEYKYSKNISIDGFFMILFDVDKIVIKRQMNMKELQNLNLFNFVKEVIPMPEELLIECINTEKIEIKDKNQCFYNSKYYYLKCICYLENKLKNIIRLKFDLSCPSRLQVLKGIVNYTPWQLALPSSIEEFIRYSDEINLATVRALNHDESDIRYIIGYLLIKVILLIQKEGNVYGRYQELYDRLVYYCNTKQISLEISHDIFKKALLWLEKENEIFILRDGESIENIYLIKTWKIQKNVIERLHRLPDLSIEKDDFPIDKNLCSLQVDTIKNAQRIGASTTTGLPGTGKTQTIEYIAKWCIANGQKIAIMTFVAKMAKSIKNRLMKVMNKQWLEENEINSLDDVMYCGTIHRAYMMKEHNQFFNTVSTLIIDEAEYTGLLFILILNRT